MRGLGLAYASLLGVVLVFGGARLACFNAELEHVQLTHPVELFLSLGESVHATRT